MKTDYEYIIQKTESPNGVITYEVNLIHPDNTTQLLTAFKGFPGGNNFRVVEEKGGSRYYRGLASRKEVELKLKGLAEKFHADDFLAILKAMRVDE
jgi:hypothetical protein